MEKASGGYRIISAPDAELKAVQRAMHEELFPRVFPAPTRWRVRDAVRAAAAHRDRDVIVRLDISNAFPTTTAAMTAAALRRTTLHVPAQRLVLRLCTDRDCLPQGSPASNRLLDEVLRPLDERIGARAEAAGATYQRYVDDFTISGGDVVLEIAVALVSCASGLGYTISPDKRRIGGRGTPVEITGVIVDGMALRTNEKFAAKTAAALDAHRAQRTLASERRVRGALAWQVQVDPDAELVDELHDALVRDCSSARPES